MSDSTSVQRVLCRREVIRLGGAGVFGFGLADLLELRRRTNAEGGHSEGGRSTADQGAKSCVVIWLDGGPSHLETLDPKSAAPREVRGPFDSIATKLPGVEVSECLPLLAQRLDRMAIIRSMTSPLGEHNFGTHYLMTGYRPTPVLEYPVFTSASAEVRQCDADLPAHIAVPDFRVGGGNRPAAGAPARFRVESQWQRLFESTRRPVFSRRRSSQAGLLCAGLAAVCRTGLGASEPAS